MKLGEAREKRGAVRRERRGEKRLQQNDSTATGYSRRPRRTGRPPSGRRLTAVRRSTASRWPRRRRQRTMSWSSSCGRNSVSSANVNGRATRALSALGTQRKGETESCCTVETQRKAEKGQPYTVGTQRKAEIHKADRPTQPGNISDQNAVKTQRLPAG